jgi:hypothetical protein
MRSSSTTNPPARAVGSDAIKRGLSSFQSTWLPRLKSHVEYVAATIFNTRAVGRISLEGNEANAITARNAVPPAWPTVAYRSETAPNSSVSMGLRDSQLHGPFRIFSGFGPNRGTQLAILSSFPTNPAPSRTAGTLRRSQASRPRLRPAASITNISMTIARNTYDHGHSAGLPG